MFNLTMVSKPNQAASNKQYTISKHLSITINYQTVTTLTEEEERRKKERKKKERKKEKERKRGVYEKYVGDKYTCFFIVLSSAEKERTQSFCHRSVLNAVPGPGALMHCFNM